MLTVPSVLQGHPTHPSHHHTFCPFQTAHPRMYGPLWLISIHWKDHVQKASKTSYYYLRQLRSIRGSQSANSCSALVWAFISSQLDYCHSLLTGIDKSQVNKLQSILRVAARLVMRKGKFEPISDDIRDKLHWLPIQQRIRFKICVLVYRCLHGTAPSYLSEMLSAAADIAGRQSLWSAAHEDLVVPRSRTVRFGSRMFAVSDPTLWNSLTSELKNSKLTEPAFKKQLKTFLFRTVKSALMHLLHLMDSS